MAAPASIEHQVTAGEIVASTAGNDTTLRPGDCTKVGLPSAGRRRFEWADGTVVTGPSKARLLLKTGDILRILTGSGGGDGHWFDRPAYDALCNVLDSKVTRSQALAFYGVAIEGDRIAVEATRRLRIKRPIGEKSIAVYDRGEADDVFAAVD